MSISNKTLLYPTEIVYRRPPRNLNHQDNHLFSNEYACVLEDCYAYQYENAIVTSRGLAVHYDDDASSSVQPIIKSGLPKIIPQCITGGKVSIKIIIKSILQHINSLHSDEIEKAILFTDTNSHGYFHWFTDALPRLLSCEHIEKNDYTIIIPDKFYTPFAKESLDLLGIDEKQIYIISGNQMGNKMGNQMTNKTTSRASGKTTSTMIKVQSLWTMDHPATPAGTGNYRPLLMQKLNAIMKEHLFFKEGEPKEKPAEKPAEKPKEKPEEERAEIEKKFGKKIYISRKDAKYRHLINEQEIESIMKENGFAIINASELSLREQMILFSEAEILVSLHGAGLSNMIWMPPHSKVAEIRLQNDTHNNCYFALASALDIAYYYSIATSEDEEIHKANLLWDKAAAVKLLEDIYA